MLNLLYIYIYIAIITIFKITGDFHRFTDNLMLDLEEPEELCDYVNYVISTNFKTLVVSGVMNIVP